MKENQMTKTPVERSTMGGQETSPACLRFCQLQRQQGKIPKAMDMKNKLESQRKNEKSNY